MSQPVRRRVVLAACTGAAVAALTGCAGAPAPVVGQPPRGDAVVVYLTARGWHTGLALPVPQLRHGPLRPLLRDFPDADELLFGWGERGYYMAPHPTASDALRALFPGPAVLLVTPLRGPPQTVPSGAEVFPLGLSTAGFDRLAAYVWAGFARTPAGMPRRISAGLAPGSAFYAAHGTYSAADTCNTWTAEALRVAGLPVTVAGTVFAHELVDQVRALPAARS